MIKPALRSLAKLIYIQRIFRAFVAFVICSREVIVLRQKKIGLDFYKNEIFYILSQVI